MQTVKNIAAAAAVLSVVLLGSVSPASAAEAAGKAQQTQKQDVAHSQPACDVAGKFCDTYFGQ
jgi:hypothetical protein